MSEPLRVLIVEDSEDDARLVLRELRRSGFAPESERVESAGAMRAALSGHIWDVILSDYMIPGFGGLDALRIAKESALDLPFILVSNKVSEETLVEAMRAGATDFVMKDRLGRLGSVVKRELVDAAARRGVRRAQIEWRTAFDSVRDPIFVHDAEYRIVRANLAYAALGRMATDDVIGKRYWEVFPAFDGPLPGCRAVTEEHRNLKEEEFVLPTGEIFSSRSSVIADERGEYLYSFHVLQDVTERRCAEQALRESEETLSAIASSAQDAIVMLDNDGTIVLWNAAAERIFGHSREDAVGKDLHRLIAPARFHESFRTGFRRFRSSGEGEVVGKTLELAALRKDGTEFPVELSLSAVLLKDKWHALGVIRDITERKSGEEKLRLANAVVESSATVLFRWRAEQGWPVNYVSENVRQFGYAAEELLSADVPYASLIHRDDLPRVGAEVEQYSAAGAAQFSQEYRIVTRSGTVRWVDDQTTVERDAAGKIAYYQGLVTDITERRQAQEAVNRSERHFRKLIEGGVEAFFVIDQAGAVRYRSPTGKRLTGWDDEEVIGKSIAHFILPEYLQLVGDAIAETIRDPDKASNIELRIRRKDGTVFDLEATARNLLADPDVGGIVVTAHDISGRKLAERTERDRMRRIEAQAQALSAVAASEAVVSGDVERIAREVTELASRATGVERANVWLFNDAETELRCIDLYETAPARHSAGAVLRQAEFESEFSALKSALYVDAHDPLTDPRTSGYAESYLKPLRITSMLDALVQIPGRHFGLLCLEHVDRPHHWEHDEIAFACQLADKLALAITNRARLQAQEAQLAQFKLAETFFNHSLSCIVILDRSFNFVRVNQAYAKNCRKEIGDFAGRNHFEMYPSDAKVIFEEVVRTRRPYEIFARAFVYPDQPERGTTYWDWTLVPILDREGEVEFLVFSLNEVTERKRAEEEQRAAALYARSLIEASLDPLVTISPEGKITDVNRMTEEVTGCARTELIGTDFADYFTEPEQARAGYRQVLAQGYVRDYPLTIRHPSGRTTDVLYNATVYRDEAGELQGVFAAARDITERKQAEAVSTQLAAIVQSSNDAIIGKDLDGNVSSWNPGAEKVYGYRADEIVGRPVSVLAPVERKVEAMRLIEAVRRGDTVANFETERVRKNGARIDVSLTMSPIRDASGHITGVSTIARDVTEKKQAERALHKVNRALRALSHCNAALVHATDEPGLLNEICRVITDISGYRMAWVGSVEHDENKTVRPVAQSGYDPGVMEQADITWADNERGSGPLGIAIRTNKIQVVQDVTADPRFARWRAGAARLGYGSLLVAPLAMESGVIGALSINAGGANAFDEEEVQLLTELASDMAYGIAALRMRAAHEQSAKRLQRSMEATVGTIAATVEARDPYTAGHQRRVAELAVAIAREMGLAEDRVHGLHLAGVIHDLGKIHIPAEILSKPSKLSRIEFELIKSHPEAGYDILKGVDFPWPIADVVVQHHERIDGSGYPRGLKGDQILLEARILTVADVVEAMASHRPYRPTLGIDAALNEIAANAGTYYDADVAKACIVLFRDKGFRFTTGSGAAA